MLPEIAPYLYYYSIFPLSVRPRSPDATSDPHERSFVDHHARESKNPSYPAPITQALDNLNPAECSVNRDSTVLFAGASAELGGARFAALQDRSTVGPFKDEAILRKETLKALSRGPCTEKQCVIP